MSVSTKEATESLGGLIEKEILVAIDFMVKEGLSKDELVKMHKHDFPQIVISKERFEELLKQRGLN